MRLRTRLLAGLRSRTFQWGSVVVVGLVGAWLGMVLWGSSTTTMGPFTVELRGGFGRGQTEIALPPLGRVSADTHVAPLTLRASPRDVDVDALTETLGERTVKDLTADVEKDARGAVVPFALRLVGVAAGGALGLALLAFRGRGRRVTAAVLVAAVAVGAGETAAWGTFRTAAFEEPTFSGSLRLAPQLVGRVEEVAERIDAFRAELRRVVSGAVRAYTALDPTVLSPGDEIRALHISDVHLSPLGLDFALELAESFDVDLVVDTGDLTSFGTPPEELVLSRIPRFDRPYVFVRGNHDAPGLADAMRGVPNAVVLDSRVEQVRGLRIYGFGHPAFTEDETDAVDHGRYLEVAAAGAESVREDLVGLTEPPDLVAVHDDRLAAEIAGLVPLVVSGHFHTPSTRVVDGTLFLRTGSTGGGGANVFTPEGGGPFAAQILHFAEQSPKRLVAYDRIEQDPETGSLVVRRHRVADERGASPSPGGSPVQGGSPSPTVNPSPR